MGQFPIPVIITTLEKRLEMKIIHYVALFIVAGKEPEILQAYDKKEFIKATYELIEKYVNPTLVNRVQSLFEDALIDAYNHDHSYNSRIEFIGGEIFVLFHSADLSLNFVSKPLL